MRKEKEKKFHQRIEFMERLQNDINANLDRVDSYREWLDGFLKEDKELEI